MITEQDLQAAIAECEGIRNPTPSTCVKLAAYYAVKDRLYGKKIPDEARSYSFAPDPSINVEKAISYSSDTEFARAISGRKESEIWPIIDELMSVLQATNIRLYNGVMRKIDT